jgi:hypothetical protein
MRLEAMQMRVSPKIFAWVIEQVEDVVNLVPSYHTMIKHYSEGADGGQIFICGGFFADGHIST